MLSNTTTISSITHRRTTVSRTTSHDEDEGAYGPASQGSHASLDVHQQAVGQAAYSGAAGAIVQGVVGLFAAAASGHGDGTRYWRVDARRTCTATLRFANTQYRTSERTDLHVRGRTQDSRSTKKSSAKLRTAARRAQSRKEWRGLSAAAASSHGDGALTSLTSTTVSSCRAGDLRTSSTTPTYLAAASEVGERARRSGVCCSSTEFSYGGSSTRPITIPSRSCSSTRAEQIERER